MDLNGKGSLSHKQGLNLDAETQQSSKPALALSLKASKANVFPVATQALLNECS